MGRDYRLKRRSPAAAGGGGSRLHSRLVYPLETQQGLVQAFSETDLPLSRASREFNLQMMS